MSSRRFITVAEICEDLGIQRSTWDDWRAKGKVPPYRKLPNGQLRIRRTDYDRWYEQLEGKAA